MQPDTMLFSKYDFIDLKPDVCSLDLSVFGAVGFSNEWFGMKRPFGCFAAAGKISIDSEELRLRL